MIEQIKELAIELNNGKSISDHFFSSHKQVLESKIKNESERLYSSSDGDVDYAQAKHDLENWARDGKKQAYTHNSLFLAKIARKISNEYEVVNAADLLTANALHQAAVTYAFNTNRNLVTPMCLEGKEGRKFGLVEMADRLGPALQPTGSSVYYQVKYVPYGIESRALLGEVVQEGKSLVTSSAAIESASNLINKFGVHYALAETSAAPRREVPKSGKKPILHICAHIKYIEPSVETHEIDTLLRTEFDSRVRENMYFALQRLFIKNDK